MKKARLVRILGSLVALALMTTACVGETGGSVLPPSEVTTRPTTAMSGAETTRTTIEDSPHEITGVGSIASILLAPCTNISVYTQANSGVEEAAAELGSAPAEFVGPTDCYDAAGQIEAMTNAVTRGVDAIMLSNNAGDQMDAPAAAAADAGIPVITWDSPIPSATGESVFVTQVDFSETGSVMAEMARDILGDGGQLAILSTTPDAASQNAWIAAMEERLATPAYADVELVETVYGNDDVENSVAVALRLVGSYPELELIMAPTTVGIVAAAQAMTDEGHCDTTKVSGLGLPEELAPYVESGCVPEFAWWSFVDLGYLTYYTAYGIATGQIEAADGTSFTAGRLGDYGVSADPTREAGLRVVMSPFSIYNADNPGT